MLTVFSGAAFADGIIDNGTIQLGINEFGTLIEAGVGITYLPTNGEALAPGCACEGWGIADLGVGTGFGRSESNGNSGTGTSTLVFSGTGTLASSIGSSAVATTTIQEGGADFARVVHSYTPSASVNLYQVDVTMTNLGGLPITNLVYRRAMDWDVPPTTFSEFVTLQGWPATALFRSSDDGFEDPNPNSGPLTSISPTATVNGNFTDSGPDDHGAAFDFTFGSLAAGGTQTFTIYYGAAGTVDDALSALGTVGAEVYSLGYPNDGSGGLNPTGAPNVFMFAFAGVGGTPVGGGTGGPVSELELLRSLGAFVASTMIGDPMMRMSGATNGGESADAVSSGLRFIATGGFSGSSFDTQTGVAADVDVTHGGMVAEYVFDGTGSLVGPRAGIGIDFGRASGSLATGASADVSATTLHAYAGTSFSNGAYIDASLGYGWLGYDTLRAPGAGDFRGDFDGSQFSAMIRGGIDRPVTAGTLPGALTLGMFGSALWTQTDIDGFTETSATLPGGAVSIAKQSVSSVTTRLGARANYTAPMSNGGTFIASTWVAWEHQATDGDAVNITSAGGTTSALAVSDVRRNLAVVGLRLGANVSNNVTFTGEYEGGFGDDYERHNVSARLKLKW